MSTMWMPEVKLPLACSNCVCSRQIGDDGKGLTQVGVVDRLVGAAVGLPKGALHRRSGGRATHV
eukprot:365469-Chlamydomonas_euryale.AAC.7